mgnify:CR=1 FL=1
MSESDPNKIDQHQPGAKLDEGKNRLGLVFGGFSNALRNVGKVGTYGANKYTDNGWREVPDAIERYTDALLRHQIALLAGETIDFDSGLRHVDQVAWNALAIAELSD